MAESVGFHEIIPDQSCSSNWRNVTINTGASQSTLQDIKVPEYGGGYVYKGNSTATTNRYIFWRVSDDSVELLEQSLDIDLTHNHMLLRIVGLPVLEGISVHEVGSRHVVLLIATIASTHCFTLPHPNTLQQSTGDGLSCPSILRELDQHNLREVHSMHLLATPAVEAGRVHTACSGMLGPSAVFLFGQPSAALLLLTMDAAPSAVVHTTPGGAQSCSSSPAQVTLIKNTSLVNRLFMGFVPGIFRGGEGSDTISSLSCVAVTAPGSSQTQVYGVGVCGDGRLRMWCVQRKECVLLHDTLEDTAEAATRNTPTGQRHMVVSRATAGGGAVVAVLLSFVEKQLLLLYSVAIPAPQRAAAGAPAPAVVPRLTHIKTLYPPQHHLVDMDLTPTHVWTLWTDANNDNQLLFSELENRYSTGLSRGILQAAPEKSIPNADTSLDPREVYLQHLFAPYQFSRHTITKALSIYRGSSSSGDGSNASLSSLRDEVESVLQGQLESKFSPDMTPDELYDLTLDTWENFYSHTLQYHQVDQKGMGVVCGSDGAVTIVRRRVVSWMSAVDGVEAMVADALAAPPTQDLTQIVMRCGVSSVLRGDSAVAASVAGVVRCVAVVRAIMDGEVAAAFMLDMAHHCHPEVVAEDVASSMMAQVVGGDEVAGIISNAVCGVPNFPGGLRLLVNSLNLDTAAPDALPSSAAHDDSSSRSGSQRSQLWSSLLAASLHHLASTRLNLCRDLLVLQQSALQLAQLCHLSPDSVGQLRSSIVQDTVLVTRAYHALLCLTRAPAVLPSQQQLHSIRRVVAALALQDNTPHLPPLSAPVPHTALSAVLQQGACPQVQLSQRLWVSAAVEAVRSITKVAWPLQNRSGSTALLEALVFCGQGEAALHYIRQVCDWCEWSLCSRHFLLGMCLLLQGQYRKAARLLQEAGEGCATEELLGERVGGGGEGARVNYTLRLVRLFEVFQQPGLALRLATSALGVAQQSPAQLSQLYAVLFKHHLALAHHDQAFTALLSNPDPGPQKACLRQLLVALHHRGCLSTLVNYEYGNLTCEVVTILENRARSADILVNNYYHLLYAFHVHKHNYKRAASVMYECAIRLNTEGIGEKGLKEQLKCYLACINCLKLLPAESAWILKPTPALSCDVTATEQQHSKDLRSSSGRLVRSSSKRSVGGTVCVAAPSRSKRSSKCSVLELPHIDREYQLVHAKLTLHSVAPQTHCTTAGGISDADSTISLLCHSRLYREAVRLCRLFDKSISPVVQSLAAACVQADLSTDSQQHAVWLKHNDVTNETSGWWNLLREIMNSGKEKTLLHTVASTLLDRSHQLPPWLLDAYTVQDYGGLLSLLLRYGHLEDAALLALRLLDAVTSGINCDQFGLQSAVHITSAPVWLPYRALDHLLLELGENKHQLFYDKVLTQLEGKLHRYQTEASRVSRDKVQLLQRCH